jgi:N-acyl-D-aspartate/D-glutamate deacylase
MDARLAALAVESRVPITFGIIPLGGGGAAQLRFIDKTAAAGGRVFGQTHSRGITNIFSFRSHLPFDRIGEWQRVRSLPPVEQERALADSDTRRSLVRSANAAGLTVHGPGKPVADFESMWIFDHPTGDNRLMADEARARGVDPVELMIDLALGSELNQLFLQARCRTDDDELLNLMRHARTVMTFSDSGAHVTRVSDSSLQTYLLGQWVRERQAFSLEEGIRMVTLAPAQAWGFSDRGLIREGLVADLNVLNPETIEPELPYLAFDLPKGAARLIQKSRGIAATIVGGEVTLRKGESTGATPGVLIRAGGRSGRG